MWDSNSIIRAQTDHLDDTETSSAFDANGIDLKDRCYAVNVPVAPTGTSPTLDVKIQGCDTSGGTYVDCLAFPQITTKGEFYVRGRVNYRYRKAVSTVGGTGTPDFGHVTIGILPAGRDDNK